MEKKAGMMELARAVRNRAWAVCMAAALAAAGPAARADEEKVKEFEQEIRPLLEAKCYDCHGPDVQKADLNLSFFQDFEAVVNAPEIFEMVFERVQAFEMPPEKGPEMKFGEQRKLVKWLRNLPKPESDCDKLASDRTASFYRGYVMSRRLNRAEYENSVRDLFGMKIEVAELLPADGGGGEGFDTTGNALFTSPIHIERYMQAAEQVVEEVLPLEGDGVESGRLAARERVLGMAGEKRETREGAAEILRGLSRRAFRRPVADEEVERLLVLFDRGRERGDSFAGALQLPLQGILISPHFLFLAEAEPAEGGVHALGPLPLASKLSYFIWSSLPDEELLALAESGELLRPEVYEAQIDRMLLDERAEALGERFAVQWLDLHRLGSEVRPDPAAFPEFDLGLEESMRKEVVTYFNYVLQNDRSLLELIDSDYTFVNARLSTLYGIEPPAGREEMQRVSLKDGNRGGVTGMAGVHTLTSYPLRTSPVLRGKWVMETLLGDRVPPPPPDVPALEESEEAVKHLTLREQLELHRSKAECSSCHDRMDPLGFGLENFDVLGRWRDKDRGQAIDATGTLPSGQSFSGPQGLKELLMSRRDDVIEHLARKMTGYAFGRELTKFDECVVERAMEALAREEYRASVLVRQIATSYPFRHRFYPKHD